MKHFSSPLADRMRPEKLEDFLGQEEILGKGKLLQKAIESDQLPSMIFWGPPGSGKTTLAYIIAKKTKSDFKKIVKIVKNPKYICIKCARVAIEKKYLCEPEKMQ